MVVDALPGRDDAVFPMQVIRIWDRAVGTLEVSRLASGRHETFTIEIFGEKGSLAMDLGEPRQARIYRLARAAWQPCEPVQNELEQRSSWGFFERAASLQDFFLAAHLASIEDFLCCIL